MPTHLIRSLLVSTLVLGSFGTVADAALAEEAHVSIAYDCTVPRVGAERCGDANQNLHVGRGKRLSIYVDVSSVRGACMTFFVNHAVSGKLLATSGDMCDVGKEPDRTWTNPKDEPVDVYVTVKSDVSSQVKIEGRYVIAKP
jgi:hypothetical protein